MSARQSFDLRAGEIHIWVVWIPRTRADTVAFERILTCDEVERADSFHFGHLRASFVVTRGVLRFLLGAYLQIAPVDIQFSYGSDGKPGVVSENPFHFNLSHSGRLALAAFTRECPIGVDVEEVRHLPDMERIADLFFCPEEALDMASVPGGERERAFFGCWTRKEAYIKAIGSGLSIPLNDFRVTLRPGLAARIVHVRHDPLEAEAWTLHDLPLKEGYVAALAYRGSKLRESVRVIRNVASFATTIEPKTSSRALS